MKKRVGNFVIFGAVVLILFIIGSFYVYYNQVVESEKVSSESLGEKKSFESESFGSKIKDFFNGIVGAGDNREDIKNIALAPTNNLQAFHRNGQTFLTWDEVGNYFPENLNFSQYDDIRNANLGIRYRIYRFTAPISSSNINQAIRIADVGIGTAYNFYLYGKEGSDPWGSRAGQDIPRFVIQEGIGGWGSGELSLNTGLYVHTTAESSGNFYYAITLVNNSVEDRTSFSSLSIPISETYNSNWKPVLQNRSFV